MKSEKNEACTFWLEIVELIFQNFRCQTTYEHRHTANDMGHGYRDKSAQ